MNKNAINCFTSMYWVEPLHSFNIFVVVAHATLVYFVVVVDTVAVERLLFMLLLLLLL